MTSGDCINEVRQLLVDREGYSASDVLALLAVDTVASPFEFERAR